MSGRIEVLSYLLDQIPNELWERQILPHLTYHQLTKVARASTKFAIIVKNTAPFIINTIKERWLDRTRVRLHAERCRNLTLYEDDYSILNHISSSNELQLEALDVQWVKFPDRATIAQCIKNIFKNNKPGALQILKLPVLDFKILSDVTCPSVRQLSIYAWGTIYGPDKLKTADLLQIFPSLKQLHIDDNIASDLYDYLAELSDTQLDHVGIQSSQMEEYIDKLVKVPLKSLTLIGNGVFEPRFINNFNFKHMKHLKLELYHYDSEPECALPNLENLESLELLCGVNETSALLFEHSTRLTHLEVRNPHPDMKYPQSLKSLIVRHDDLPVDKIAALPYLESLEIEHEAISFWFLDQILESATTLQRLKLFSENVDDWSPMINQFVNLTHVTLKFPELHFWLPKEFFQSCPKITHLSLEGSEKVTQWTVPSELSLLTQLEHFWARSCGLTEIPSGLKDLPCLRSIDLRGNPFTLESVPVTLPVKTVVFRDREWIQLIQRYLADPSNAPTVAQILKLPYLSNECTLNTSKAAQRVLQAFDIPVEQTNTNDLSLAGGSVHSSLLDKDGSSYLDKDTTIGIILINEWHERENYENKPQIARVESDGTGKIKTYSFSSLTRKSKGCGLGVFRSKSFWGLVHEFEGAKVNEIERKILEE